MALDDDCATLLGRGAVIVQRGTMHLWRSPSPIETCRIVFILIEAKPYRHEGVSLQQIQP